MSRLLDGVVVVGTVVVVPVLLAVGVTQPRTADVQHVNPSTVVTSAAQVGLNLQHRLDVETAYMRGMDDGVADYCQEVGGDGSDHGTCVLPEPEVVKVNVPGPERIVTRTVVKTVNADTLQCPGGFVAWDQRKGGGEWAYCESGARPAGAR